MLGLDAKSCVRVSCTWQSDREFHYGLHTEFEMQALLHACIACSLKPSIEWIASSDLQDESAKSACKPESVGAKFLKGYSTKSAVLSRCGHGCCSAPQTSLLGPEFVEYDEVPALSNIELATIAADLNSIAWIKRGLKIPQTQSSLKEMKKQNRGNYSAWVFIFLSRARLQMYAFYQGVCATSFTMLIICYNSKVISEHDYYP
ncbi:hypothetical protein M8C21_028332 [Ambrosia artemisiifolia]|uniref:Uncharacterized protein n=1 Tax=Ambrosia artemisiifolia TaxID=4212 RepID=A0AAD5D2B1_AMBAR|nr:hypothetical protein M8C21_028332 [Ambrosia artemisiifolia]